MTQLSAFDVSEYILKGFSTPDEGDIISNIKLQKLLYYAQGIHLVKHDKPLFKEKIHYHPYGPVVQEVYEKYRRHNGKAIPLPKKEIKNISKFSEDDKKTLDKHISHLVNMQHGC